MIQYSTTVLAYHRLSKFPVLAGTWNTPGQFAAQIRLLHKRGVNFVDPQCYESTFSDIKPSVLITFDDGLADMYFYRSVLASLDIRPLVFIPTDYIGQKNSWEWSIPSRCAYHLTQEQIRELVACRWEFGLHSASHGDLTVMNQTELTREIDTARNKLSDVTEQPVRFFSLPFGRSTPDVVERIKAGGFQNAFVMTSAGQSVGDPFLQKRRPVYCIDTPRDVLAKVADQSANTLFGRYQVWKENSAHAVGRWSAPLLSRKRRG